MAQKPLKNVLIVKTDEEQIGKSMKKTHDPWIKTFLKQVKRAEIAEVETADTLKEAFAKIEAGGIDSVWFVSEFQKPDIERIKVNFPNLHIILFTGFDSGKTPIIVPKTWPIIDIIKTELRIPEKRKDADDSGIFGHLLNLEKLEAGAKQFVSGDNLTTIEISFNLSLRRVVSDHLDVLKRMKKSPEHARNIATKLERISKLPDLPGDLASSISKTAEEIAGKAEKS